MGASFPCGRPQSTMMRREQLNCTRESMRPICLRSLQKERLISKRKQAPCTAALVADVAAAGSLVQSPAAVLAVLAAAVPAGVAAWFMSLKPGEKRFLTNLPEMLSADIGVFEQFSDGREQACLEHVRSTVPAGDPKAVLAAIDAFATSTSWLMNVGPRKGAVLDSALAGLSPPPRRALELGAYCGYSGVRIASQLPEGAKLFSIEKSPKNAAVASGMLQHAGLAGRAEVINGTLDRNIEALRAKGVDQLDFVFIDHAKEAYKPDLQLLMDEGLLRKGCVVIADNCLIPGCPEYLAWMKDCPRFESQLVEGHVLEYVEADSTTLKDAMMVSTFLG